MDDDLCFICQAGEQEILWNHNREGLPWIAVCMACDDAHDVEDYLDDWEDNLEDLYGE